VTTAPAITRHWPDIPDRLHEIGISPNGRYLCIATPASGHLRLQFWCDGTSTGEWLLSLADLSRLIRPGKIDNLSVTLLVCDNGRSYLTIETQTISVKAINNRTVLYAFDDNQLVATDCPPYIPVKVQFSPDGRTVMFQYPRMLRVGKGEISHTEIENVATVARVTIERMQLTYTDKRTLPYYSGLEANETVLTENKIENLDGTLTWSTGNWDMMESSINGRYLLLSNENQDRLRVIALDTLRSWETHIKGEVFWNAWPTEDGRACLIRERTNPADSRLVDLACEYLPFLARFSSGGDYFSLYQSHDRLIARLPYTNNPPFTLCVSPDGRSLLFSPSDEELQLYRY